VPGDWSKNIVTFKTYSTQHSEGDALWHTIQDKLQNRTRTLGLAETMPSFGDPVLVKPRLGQGAFRVMVTDAYGRRCVVTRERTLPALDAAHIRPYADGGEHAPSNGLLLRRDIHSLFDSGYVTINPESRFEVSRRIRDDFENGKDYYALHGSTIEAPLDSRQAPDRSALKWHNEKRYLG
jgi:putative restriction endonuclease